jgi:hypothetical protein
MYKLIFQFILAYPTVINGLKLQRIPKEAVLRNFDQNTIVHKKNKVLYTSSICSFTLL